MTISPKVSLAKITNTILPLLPQIRQRTIAFIATTALLVTISCINTQEVNALPVSLAAANQSETTYPTDDNQVGGLLYSDDEQVKSLNSVDDFVDPQTQQALNNPAQIPAVKQPILDRSDPDNKLLEKTKQMFEDAGNFSAN